MADATLIKEFLVGLGYQIDEASQKKFKDGIQGATKAVAGLATAVAGMAVGVAVGVAKFTASLEDLYFVSKRTGASVMNIKAVDLAARDLGASSEDARGALEGLAGFMRNTPNSEGFLKNMGVQTKDAKGHMLDATDVLANMGDKFRELQKTNPGMAKAYAGMFGFSDNMTLAMMDPGFRKTINKYRQQNKGTDWNKEASKAHGQMDKIREMQSKMDALKMRVGQDMETLSDRVLPIFDKILKKIIDLDKQTNGWSTDIGLAGIAILALLGPISKVVKAFRVLAGLGGAGAAAGGAAAAEAGVAAAGGGVAGEAASAAGIGLLGTVGAVTAAGVGGWLAGKGIYSLLSDKAKESIGRHIAQVMEAFGSKDAHNALQAERQTNLVKGHQSAIEKSIRSFMAKGWSKEAATGIVANILKESHFDPNITGDGGHAYGLGQWHEDRQARFKRWSGHDIRHSTREEQEAFYDYELRHGDKFARKAGVLLKAVKNSAQAASIVSRLMERPKHVAQEAAARGALATSIEQSTTIHVHGSGDPHKAAKAVAHEQHMVNKDMARNMPGVVR